MTNDRFRRIESLFHAASARPPDQRAAFLDQACGDDVALRRDVQSLLNDSGSDDGFLARPAVILAPQIVPRLGTVTTGQMLAWYRLEELLGAGGMGEVYRAHDTRLDRKVAIKILPPAFTAHPERLARFEREARLLAALNHPNICAIHGVEEASGTKFLILELVDGETLGDKVAGGAPLPLGLALPIMRQIAEALEVAHERGIIHRDLKPANINITPDGLVKVLDFGLAKSVDTAESADLSNAAQLDGVNGTGAVIGTAAYMSPEQARGANVDKRTDIWAFGCVFYEVLSGRRAFGGDTASDAIARILEREPDWSALPPATPQQVLHLLRRCLSKDVKQRLRDIGDAKLEIDDIGRVNAAHTTRVRAPARQRRLPRAAALLALVAAVVGIGVWLATRPGTVENPFAAAQFSTLTDWEGSEALADISPDGRFVVFLSDRSGQLDLWWTQVGTNAFRNLTEDLAPLDSPGVLRTFGFSGDGSEIWFGGIGRPNMVMPQTGGTPRPFLADDAKALAWSPDGGHIAYFTLSGGRDPLAIADRTGADARPVDILPSNVSEWAGIANGRGHNHNPVWSPDGQWIYFVHGVVRDWNHSSDEMDIWRIRPAGGAPERVTHLDAAITFIAPLDSGTLLYVAPAEDGSGSWLWSFDLNTRTAHKVVSGLEQFTSIAISRDATRLVATRVNPTATLWTVPIVARELGDGDVRPYDGVDSRRAHAPRFGGNSLFYLSARGTGDGLWRLTEGNTIEVHRGMDGILLQAPGPSRDGNQVAVVRKRDNKHLLTVMSANGTASRTLAPSLDVHGTPDWSPDGQWIVTGGIDAQGRHGLFKVPVGSSAGEPIRIADGESVNPVWSRDGTLIVYAGPFVRGQAQLFAVRPDGTPFDFPPVRVSPGGYRLVPDGTSLVYLPRPESLDFWTLDLGTKQTRQLTRLANHGTIRRFDITPEGTHIVFDRIQHNADIILIERPKP